MKKVLQYCPLFTFAFFFLSCSAPKTAVSLSSSAVNLSSSNPLTGAALDDMEDTAQTIISQAAGAASLVTSKAARDVELLIQNARQELHDELDTRYNDLNSDQQRILGTIKTGLMQLDSEIAQAGEFKDQLVLDIDDTLNALPFTKTTPKIQRVTGATQYYRSTGLYRLEILNSFTTTDGEPPEVSIESIDKGGKKKSLELHALGLLPHKLVVTINSTDLNDNFKDDELADLTVVIVAQVKNRNHFYQFWRSRMRPATFRFTLELFPKYPAQYQLITLNETPSYDTSQVKTQKGEITTVAGCGNSGCNMYITVCNTKVPTNAKIIGISAYYDSFNGWGGFDKNKNYVTNTGMCSVYWQHSHNQARNVSIDVDYYPPATTIVDERTAKLMPISFDNTDGPEARAPLAKCPEPSSAGGAAPQRPTGLSASISGPASASAPLLASYSVSSVASTSLASFEKTFLRRRQ